MVALTLENFQQVVEQSKQQAVLVMFWAEQVAESIELKTKLEQQLASQNTIELATVDCQAEQQIAMQFGIQALPTMVMLQNAQPVDGLAGPQTDEALAAFFDKYLPKPEDDLLVQAKQAISEQSANQAYTFASQAYQLNSERADIQFALIEAALLVGKLEQAEQLLSAIKMIDQDADYQALKAKLELAKEAADSPEIKALEQALAEQADNVELVHQLAAQYVQANRHQDALELLFGYVRKDLSDQVTKNQFVDVLKALPEGDNLASKYRRKLYTLMY